MKIGELVLDIAVAGAGKAKDALSGVKNFLTDTSLEGLATKTAIGAAVFALERWTSQSAKFGNAINNQSLLTGISTTRIQQWGEYMRKSGADAQDAAASLQAAQVVLTAIKKGEGVPIGISAIARDTHKNPLEYLDKPEEFALLARNYARKTKDSIGVANSNLASVGITPGGMAAFRKNGEDISQITANISSETQIQRLDKVYVHWSNLWASIEGLRNALTANWGLPIIEQLEKGVKVLQEFVYWLNQAKDFSGLGKNVLNKLWGEAPKGTRIGAPDVKSNVVPLKRNPLTPLKAGEKTSQVEINIQQNGVEDTHDSIDAFRNEIARAYASISTIGTVA